MASEQRVSRKKQSRNIPSEERCLPLLYRHQDCIPNPKILHNCEKLNSLCCNSNQDIECRGKLVNQKTANTPKNKSKTLETNVKNESKTDNTKLDPKLNQTKPNGALGNNEELSKSRRRRLRKRRLLISLAPTLNSTKPSPLVENVPQLIPVTRPLTRPSTSLPLSSSPNSKTSEANKPSIKESRKRIDKSVGSRIKHLKNKTLSDSTNQSKADIIKCLEEKKRSSLLQSLTNLTNSSPKKEKTSIPLVSFPDKRLTSPESNISNDGVFYFGETKHQLEKLTSISSYPDHENSNIKPISQLKQRSSPKSVGNLASDSAPGFRFVLKSPTLNKPIPNSLPKPSPELKRNLFGFDSIALSSKGENSRLPPAKLSTNQTKDHEFKTPILKDLQCKFSIQQVINLNSGDIVPPTNITSVPNIYENNILKNSTSKTLTLSNSPGVSIADVHQARPLIKNNFMSDLQQETTCTMKPSDVPNKPTKSREEVLLEREAKKAAKLAAKMKHQNSQTLKSDGPKNDHSDLLAAVDLKDQNKKRNEENIVALNREQHSEGVISDVKSTNKNESSEKVQCKEIEVKSDKSHLPKGGVNDSTIKSKAELKAERRAKQEAQRAAKASSKTTATNQKEKKTPEINKEQIKPETDLVKVKKTVEVSKTTGQPKHKLFSHLYQEKTQLSSDQRLKVSGLHPAIVRLGIQYSSKVVVGSNSRCVALLHALKQVISDYTTPTEKEFKRGLEEELGPVKVYLNQCRPLAVSMTNALRHIKRTLTQLPNNITDIEARRKICDIIDTYITEQIDVAGKQICNTVKEKISNGDVILTYGCSSLIYKILVESHLSGIKFRVVVVDALPWREGREMLRRLVDKGLSCTYVLITAASFIMQEASKVLLGAHALLANGYVMSRAGSSQVALLAHCYNVPVLVCCETHKFCERVQTDAFVYNELGDISFGNVKDKDKRTVTPYLTPLSLAYDITPPDLVSAVVTELAVLPCTSVPVILRIKPSESVM